MKPPENNITDILVRQWLNKAEQDLEAAKILIEQRKPLLFNACFHAQQAAEKFIKAYLTWKQFDIPRTHNIRALLKIVKKLDEELALTLMDATILTPYGVEIRYPSFIPDPTLEQAEEALAIAIKVRNKILEHLHIT